MNFAELAKSAKAEPEWFDYKFQNKAGEERKIQLLIKVLDTHEHGAILNAAMPKRKFNHPKFTLETVKAAFCGWRDGSEDGISAVIAKELLLKDGVTTDEPDDKIIPFDKQVGYFVACANHKLAEFISLKANSRAKTDEEEEEAEAKN